MEAILKKELTLSKTIRRLLGVATFIILTSLGAFVRLPLPFTPVPVTLQTFFVLLSGVCLGSWLGLFSQFGYILLGATGLAVFTGGGSGLFYAFGPTGGYLFGFLLASFIAGELTRYGKNNFLLVFIKLCIAEFVLLSCGVIWLKVLLGYPLTKIIYIGFLPFMFGDFFKIMAASAIYSKIRPRLEKLF